MNEITRDYIPISLNQNKMASRSFLKECVLTDGRGRFEAPLRTIVQIDGDKVMDLIYLGWEVLKKKSFCCS